MSNPASCCHPERFTCRGAACRADLKPAAVTADHLAQIQALGNRLGQSLVTVKGWYCGGGQGSAPPFPPPHPHPTL